MCTPGFISFSWMTSSTPLAVSLAENCISACSYLLSSASTFSNGLTAVFYTESYRHHASKNIPAIRARRGVRRSKHTVRRRRPPRLRHVFHPLVSVEGASVYRVRREAEARHRADFEPHRV